MNGDYDVLVVLTTGKQDRGARATLALAWGCASLAMGKRVLLYLTMDGTIWAMQGTSHNVQVDGFEPLSAYLDQFMELGGEMVVCAPCSEYYCSLDRGAVNNILPQAQLTGLATVVSKLGAQTKVITF